MRTKRSMTATEFDSVRPLLRISDDRIHAARLALVDGQTLAGVAKLFRGPPTDEDPQGKEWTRQAVGDAMRVVWETFEKWKESERAAAQGRMKARGAAARVDDALPPGWVEVTLCAPKAMAAKFRREVAEARAAAELAAAAKKPAAGTRAKTRQ